MGNKNPHPDVEFAFVDKHGSFYVLLNHKVQCLWNVLIPYWAFLIAALVLVDQILITLEDVLHDQLFQVFVALEHVNTSPSVLGSRL